MLCAEGLSSLTSALETLLSNPEFFLSPPCREVREKVLALQSLVSGRAFGGRGAVEAASEKERKLALLRAKHHARDNDKHAVEKCALRAGRMKSLEELCTPVSLPVVLDGLGAAFPEPSALPPPLHNPRSCYICKNRFTELHFFYDSLCPSCAKLNFEKRNVVVDLKGRVALVTGARVKIGYQCALKLLRLGAQVVVTSRFPRDAALRFSKEPDFEEFRGRLSVFGLDFRDLRTLEAFCDFLLNELPRLDIIINNACQTVRRPAAYYKHLMNVELAPCMEDVLPAKVATLLNFEATFLHYQEKNRPHQRLRAIEGVPSSDATERLLADGSNSVVSSIPELLPPSPPISISSSLSQLVLTAEDDASVFNAARFLPKGVLDVNFQQVDLRVTNSWTKVAEDVESGEVAEVLAINSMAPFIICSKLKALMVRGGCRAAGVPLGLKTGNRDTNSGCASPHGARPPHPGIPAASAAFIVNVSSMEGRFYFYKLPTHPHTNMAKAALNMFTRTAARGFAEDGVFMTAVDTGWINEENPRERAAEKVKKNGGFATPLDELDAAARILDPVLAPLKDSVDNMASPLWGAFLKDFSPCEW